MCGIAGIAYFKKQKTVNTTELKLMSTAIAHRGPDDEGIYISSQKDVGLVNRRLAIIDLSAHGHQPMHYLNRYVISFNGEIYNFGEIRKNLQKLGYKFESFGDTEVIMALYDKYKSNCLKYLRGMFAIAIYDTKEETLFLARDKIGKKPLKYILDDQKIVARLGGVFTGIRVGPLLSALSRITSSSYSFQPMTDSSISTSWTGLRLRPRAASSRNSSML